MVGPQIAIVKIIIDGFKLSGSVSDHHTYIIYIMLVRRKYVVIYDVIWRKLRASLEPSWAMKIARYVEQLTHRSSEYIILGSCS